MTMRGTSVREIHELIEAWARAVRSCDLDGVTAAHADDVVMFDVPEPHRGLRGLDEYRSAWPPFFEWIGAGACFEIDEIRVEADGGVGFAWVLLRCGAEDDLNAAPSRRLRLSLGLRRHGDDWQIAHEHHSFAQT